MKKLVSLGIAFAVLFSMSGCVANIDDKHKGLSIGFNYDANYSNIMFAVRSEKNEFSVDDVTLDFYCGWFGELINWQSDQFTEQIICVAFYILDSRTMITIDPRDDYQNVEDRCLVAEVPPEEFWSERYLVTQTKRKGKIFNDSGTTVTIPKEFFTAQIGTVELYAITVKYCNTDELFYFGYDFSMRLIQIHYNYKNDNIVRIH